MRNTNEDLARIKEAGINKKREEYSSGKSMEAAIVNKKSLGEKLKEKLTDWKKPQVSSEELIRNEADNENEKFDRIREDEERLFVQNGIDSSYYIARIAAREISKFMDKPEAMKKFGASYGFYQDERGVEDARAMVDIMQAKKFIEKKYPELDSEKVMINFNIDYSGGGPDKYDDYLFLKDINKVIEEIKQKK